MDSETFASNKQSHSDHKSNTLLKFNKVSIPESYNTNTLTTK